MSDPLTGTLQSDSRLGVLLSAALARPLVVVQAPAGYGKTFSLRAWSTATPRAIAWVTLSHAENDPQVLAASLAAALGSLFASAPPSPPVDPDGLRRDWVAQIANWLRASVVGEQPMIVLERSELILEKSSISLLEALLDALEGCAQVVISTRSKPILRLARRIASGTVSELGVTDLALSRSEARGLLSDGALASEGPALDEIYEWSGGWPLAVAMAADQLNESGSRELLQSRAMMRARLASLAEGPLADYVDAEMLVDLSEDERGLLIRLATLRMFTAEMVRDLSDTGTSHQLLVSLQDHRGLVVATDTEARWLTVSPHLRAPLMAILERERKGASAATQVAARVWLEQRGLVEQALESAVLAGDVASTARLIQAHGLALVASRRYEHMEQGLELLASDDRQPSELAAVLRHVLAAASPSEHSDAYRSAASLLASAVDPDVRILAALVLASPDAGRVMSSIIAARNALDLPGTTVLEPALRCRLGFALWLDGQADQAQALLQPLVGLDTTAHHRMLAYAVLALIAVDTDETRLAERYGRAAVKLAEEDFEVPDADAALVHSALAQALQVAGKLEEARLVLDRARELVPAASMRDGLLLVFDAQLALAERRRDDARSLADQAHEILSAFADPGRALMARLAQLTETLDQRVDSATPGSMPTPAEMRVLEILAVQHSRAQIARDLFLSETTVKSHLRRLYRRLGASNRDEALVAARERGLLPRAEY